MAMQVSIWAAARVAGEFAQLRRAQARELASRNGISDASPIWRSPLDQAILCLYGQGDDAKSRRRAEDRRWPCPRIGVGFGVPSLTRSRAMDEVEAPATGTGAGALHGA